MDEYRLHTELLQRGRQLRRIAEQYDAPIREKHGLKQLEVEILFFLSTTDNATATDIYKTLQVNKGYVSQGLDALSKKGLLLMKRDQADRRFVSIELSERAEPILQEILMTHRTVQKVLLSGVTREELAYVKAILHKVFDNADRMASE